MSYQLSDNECKCLLSAILKSLSAIQTTWLSVMFSTLLIMHTLVCRVTVYTAKYVYEHLIDPHSSNNLNSTYASSLTRDLYRRYKYGADVTKVWKRGSIPGEAREIWRGIAAKHRAEAEAHSNSDSGD